MADPDGRLDSLAFAIEVHVAARRLRRIVPLEIRPNGTISLRGEVVFGLDPTIRIVVGRFYYAQSGSRDSLAQYAVRSAIGNAKTCRSSQ